MNYRLFAGNNIYYKLNFHNNIYYNQIKYTLGAIFK